MIRKNKKNLIGVVVILGDPRKPDIVKRNHKFNEEDFETVSRLEKALNSLKEYYFTYLNNHDTLEKDLEALRDEIDFVFNLCDEGFYNDPKRESDIPLMLEKLNLIYTGAGPNCMITCYDKSLVKEIASQMAISVPEGYVMDLNRGMIQPSRFPVIVKPNNADGGFGITTRSVVNNLEEFIRAIKEVKIKTEDRCNKIIVEEFLEGSDLSIGIIGNPPYDHIILPIIEEDYSILPKGLPKISGYEAKWEPSSPYWNLKSKLAKLPENTRKIIVKSSLMLFERLECRDYARFDWRLDSEGLPKLLEVNPNPGWCWDGHLAKMCNFAKIDYPGMLEYILKSARKRFEREKLI